MLRCYIYLFVVKCETSIHLAFNIKCKMGIHLALHSHVIYMTMIDSYTKKFIPTTFMVNRL